jgi:flagellar motor switch protein FliN/FliY
MSDLTPEEIEGIVKAIDAPEPTQEEKAQIPLRPPGTFGPVSRVSFSPLEGEHPKPLESLTSKEVGRFEKLKAHIEVIYGKKKASLKELAGLKEGDLFMLEELCDDLVEIHVNGSLVGRGEVVLAGGKFAVKIVSLKS